MKKIVVAGAGGHGKVVLDIVLSAGTSSGDVIGFVDDDPALIGTVISGLPVLGSIQTVGQPQSVRVAMGVGNNAARRRLFEALHTLGYEVLTVVHPRAVVARSCRVGDGVAIMANVTVNVDSCIGDDVILNTACSVDHDCIIGAHTHIAPGVRLAGNVSVGEGTLLGIGTVVIPGISIGANCVVGAGTVITKDIESGSVAVGAPARIIRRRDDQGR